MAITTKLGKRQLPPRFVPNTEYIQDEDVREHARNVLSVAWPGAPFGARYNEMMTLMPEDFGLALPPEGGWIMVRRSPPTEIKVPLLSMWYAMPDPFLRTPVGKKFSLQVFPMYRARIHTPEGPLWLLPPEYVLVQDITQYLGQEKYGIDLHFLSEEAAVDQDALFYLRSRGVSKQDALVMLLGTIRDPNFCYLTVRQEYAEALGMG